MTSVRVSGLLIHHMVLDGLLLHRKGCQNRDILKGPNQDVTSQNTELFLDQPSLPHFVAEGGRISRFQDGVGILQES